jgi:hypothetical protein
MAEEQKPLTAEMFERVEDFQSRYANNVQMEQSAFDLKLVFGQLDQSRGSLRVEQHTAITLSWTQAKLMLYYLQLNITGYEFDNGKISIRKDLIPPPVPSLTPEQENDPHFLQLVELFRILREQFVSNLPP